MDIIKQVNMSIIKEILERETKGLNINNKTRNNLIFSYDDVEGMLEEVSKRTKKLMYDYYFKKFKNPVIMDKKDMVELNDLQGTKNVSK